MKKPHIATYTSGAGRLSPMKLSAYVMVPLNHVLGVKARQSSETPSVMTHNRRSERQRGTLGGSSRLSVSRSTELLFDWAAE